MASDENFDLPEDPMIVSINGKYKGRHISELLADREHIAWLNRQPWFKIKYPREFAIVNSQRLPFDDNPTPEHNKLQNKFLNDNFLKRFCDFILKSDIARAQAWFECDFNWDVFVYATGKVKTFDCPHPDRCGNDENKCRGGSEGHYVEGNCILCPKPDRCDKCYGRHLKQGESKAIPIPCPKPDRCDNHPNTCDPIGGHYIEFKRIPCPKPDRCEKCHGIHCEQINSGGKICIEIKTSLGDEYPCVFRKMKQQIKCLNNQRPPNEFRNGIYVLLVDKLCCSSASRDELNKIFKSANIELILFEEIPN
jgi:hypothetical protein